MKIEGIEVKRRVVIHYGLGIITQGVFTERPIKYSSLRVAFLETEASGFQAGCVVPSTFNSKTGVFFIPEFPSFSTSFGCFGNFFGKPIGTSQVVGKIFGIPARPFRSVMIGIGNFDASFA